MKAHHRKHHAHGGMIEKGVKADDATPHDVYAGAGSEVIKEAKKRKHGGRAKHHHEHAHHMAHGGHHEEHMEHHAHGGKAKRPARKRGGHVHAEHAMHGHHAAVRHDRPKRKSGGRAGSNFNPLSSAHAGQEPKAHKSGDYS